MKPSPAAPSSAGANISAINNKLPTNKSATKPEENQVQFRTLRNGLRVVVIESRLNPLVQIYGAVRAGSVYEHSDEKGMSALLSALLDMGNTRINKQQLVNTQSDLGLPPEAMLKFISTAENIIFHTNCLNTDFSSQMHQMFDCLLEPRLQTDFEGAKSDLFSSLRRAEKRPEIRIERILLRSLIAPNCAYYPVHPEEQISNIGNFKPSDLSDFYHKHVTPANSVVVVCGAVKASDVFDLFEQLTQGWILNTQAFANTAASKDQIELLLSDRAAYKSSLFLPPTNSAEIVFGRIISAPNIKQTINYKAALLIADCALSSHPIFSHVGEQFDLKARII